MNLAFDFDKNTLDFLRLIVKTAEDNNIRIFFVGGLVRDAILKKPVKDVDLIVEANALDFCSILPPEISTKSIHKDFYTAKVEYKGITYDIASTRLEKYPYSGCLPVVERVGVAIEEDYKRRDFTVNSMYIELSIKNDVLKYELIDFARGLEDIKNKTLRVLHDKSYIDDSTRILRGIDFKHRFSFDFSEHDKILVEQYLKNPDTSHVSVDRTLSVFKKLCFSRAAFFEALEKKCYKILGCEDFKVDYNLIDKIVRDFELEGEKRADFYYAIILNKDIKKLICKDEVEIYKAFSALDNLAYYFYKTNDENALRYLKIKNIKLELTGADLLNLGLKQGKHIGKILDMTLKEKIKNPSLSKEDEINFAKKIAGIIPESKNS